MDVAEVAEQRCRQEILAAIDLPGSSPRIELKNASSVERPDDINCLLVKAGTPPIQLTVEEEELEQYFLRLVGMDGGLKNE